MTHRVRRAWHCAAAGTLVAMALSVAACDEPLTTIAGPSPNLEPTLSSIRSEIFASADLAGRVACVGCHTNQGRAPAGNLNLTGDVYAALVNVGSTGKSGAILVVPGNPDASYLIHKLEGGPDIAGLRMPRNTPPYLTDGQMLVIRRWIQNGAPNN